MQDKWSHCRIYLILGLVVALPLAFLLTRGLFRTEALTHHLTLSSIEQASEKGLERPARSVLSKASPQQLLAMRADYPVEDAHGMAPTNNALKDILPAPDLRLAGTGLVGGEKTYAIIVDQTIDEQGLYEVGESIKGATVVKIDRECVILEKDGSTQVLKVTRGRNTVSGPSVIQASVGPPSTGISKELPPFKPIVSETGPPVDESMPVEDLPAFKPITSETGPPVDPEQVYEDLPEFTPFVSESGPG